MRFRSGWTVTAVLLLSCAVTVAFGQATAPEQGNVDLLNLESEIPSCVEDAYVLPDDHWETQSIISWGDGDFEDWWQYRLQMSAGLSSNWQGTAGVVFKDNAIDNTGDGDFFLKFLHQFHQSEKDAALFGINLNFPWGQDYARLYGGFPPYNFKVNEREDEVDVGLTGVYTKVLSSNKPERVHFEVRETFVRSAPPGFAKQQLFLGAAYDKRIRRNTLAIGSLCWIEGANACNTASTVLSLGLRHKESRRFLWGAGLRIGLDWAAANWGLVWGAQYGL
jgi:hypothetical protein